MAEVHYVVCDRCGARADGDLTPEGWSFGAEDLCVDCNPNSRRNQAKRSAPRQSPDK